MNRQTEYQYDMEALIELLDAQAMNSLSPVSVLCTGLNEDSRLVTPGDLFIARPGLASDGRNHIIQAAENGAIAVVCESKDIEQFPQVFSCPVAVYKVKGVADKLGELADVFYGHPSRNMTVIGVTGTNGKTSCSQMIANVVSKLGQKVAVMGTLGNGLLGNLTETGNTTAGALELHGQFAEYKEHSVDVVSMEVSSHALQQGRVNGVDFNLALFTNLSRDHLDYHGDMANYAKAKKQLLTKKELDAVIINADDATGAALLNDPDIKTNKYSFSITPINARESNNSVWTESVKFHDSGIEAEIISPWGNSDFMTSMIGQFNLSNCLAVVTTLGAMGYPLKDILRELATVTYIQGRMERFGGDDKPLVIVDYAHSPDSLKHVLQAIKPHTNHKLWTVFGCGGDRDKGKRKEMAAVAEEYADYLVFTSDNPRSEDNKAIVRDMLEGVDKSAQFEIEHDRELAIRKTISKAVLGDVVLVAGKGHEEYQQIGDQKFPHSDVAIVKHALAMGGWT